jgi:hypothetical protein
MRIVVFLEILFSSIVVTIGFLCAIADGLIGKAGDPRPKAERDAQWAAWTAEAPSEKNRGNS